MSESLKAAVAIITGASKGIGKSIALSLAAEGSKVVLASRNQKELDDLAKEIRARGGTSLSVVTDVSDEAQVLRLVKKTIAEFGRIDVLVNNAGYAVISKVVDANVNDYDGMMNVNLRGPFLCSKAVLPSMIEQKRGAIINIASLAGKNALAGGAIYSATKWGLLGFSRSLMLEVREYNIRVVTICPGSVNTTFSDHSKDGEKIIQPQDVADAVLFALTMPARSNVSEIDIRPTVNPKQ
jgi:NADP-dependent 3-hydroxy acid dehydrogenase YdfG